MAAGRTLIFIGTYAPASDDSIFVYELGAKGKLKPLSAVSGVANPSFLALHPDGKRLYAVEEVGQFQGKPTGAVTAFNLDRKSGGLSLLNSESSVGSVPCHVSVDRAGRYAFAANYGSGGVCMLPLDKGGRLGKATDYSQHEGKGVDPRRQEGPHAHCIVIAPDNRFALSADLGLDKVYSYRLDPEHGKMPLNSPPWVRFRSGAGPRHIAFHPNGRFVYVICEMGNTITAFAWHAASGELRELQTVRTLPDDFTGNSTTAEIVVSANGRFVYGSNRGHDSIALFRVDERTGRLRPLGFQPTLGKTPRNFAPDPSGQFLLVANQDSDNIVTFRADPESGALLPTGHEVKVPKPVCIRALVV